MVIKCPSGRPTDSEIESTIERILEEINKLYPVKPLFLMKIKRIIKPNKYDIEN